jgi:hypothetical protein
LDLWIKETVFAATMTRIEMKCVKQKWLAARKRWRRAKQMAMKFRGLEGIVNDARLEMRMWAGAMIYEKISLAYPEPLPK